MKNIKVLILSVFPAPYRMGVFKELNKQLDVTVYFERLFDESRSSEWFEKNFDGLKGGLLSGYDNPGKKIKFEITGILGKEKYDVVLVYDYSTPTAALLILLCRMKGIPYLLNVDGAFINDNPVKGMIKKFFISGAAGCLANGEHAKKYFLQFAAKEENIFKHCFSTLYERDILKDIMNKETKSDLRKQLNLPDGKLAISVGQFIHRKGYDVLIKAWKDVNPDYQLLIIGGGEKQEELSKLINSLNIWNVKLIGFMQKEELFKYFRASDLFVLPTREDIWGLVINEAMACGLPVITTDRCIAGLELVEDYENGFIVPVDDAGAMANRINETMSNDEMIKNMGRKNLVKIQPYTIENVAVSHVEVLKKVLGISF